MLKRKLTPLVLLLSLAFIGARCYQYMYLIDNTTGYYTPHIFNTLLVVFASACCVFLAAPLLLRRSCFLVDMVRTSSKTFFCMVNLAACLAFAAVTTIGVYQLATGEKNGITDILMTVFALFAVIYFAYIFINGGSPAMGSGMHLCLIGPIGFSVVRLTVDFNQLTMNANVSGYKYLLLGLSASICFFLMFGRYQLEGTATRGRVCLRAAYRISARRGFCQSLNYAFSARHRIRGERFDRMPVRRCDHDSVCMVLYQCRTD